jgi:dodecin
LSSNGCAPFADASHRPGNSSNEVRKRNMSDDYTYRVIEVVGTSLDGVDGAIKNGVSRASETIRQLEWFEVQSVRGRIEDGNVKHLQVTLKVGFRLESPPA